MHAGHQPHRLGFENAHAVQVAQVKQHPGVAGQIGGGCEQAGMTGNAAHVTRGRIVHCSTQNRSVDPLGRRDAEELRGRRQITGVSHFQRLINFTRDEFIQLHSAYAPHHFAEQEKVDVAVTKGRVGRRHELFRARHANGSVVAGPRRLRADVRAQARRVGHQLTNSNGFFAVVFELRDVGLHPFVEFDFAPLDQQHRRRRAGDHFGQRRGVFAVSSVIRRAVSFHPQHRAGAILFGNGAFDGRVHFRKLFRMEDGVQRTNGRGGRRA